MILLVASMSAQSIPLEVGKAFSRKSIEYAGQGVLPENRRFDLVDGKINDIKYDQKKTRLTGESGWNFECLGNPILLYEDPAKILIFIEPGQMGTIRGQRYGFYLIDRKTGDLIRSKKLDKNPRSIMIFNKGLYLLLADLNKKIEFMSFQ